MLSFDLKGNRIQKKAAAWTARLRADNFTQADQQEFYRWLNADPDHAAAFRQIGSLWDEIGLLDVASMTRDLRTGQRYVERRVSRRGLFVGLGAIAGFGGLAAVLSGAQAKVYQTGVGEQKHIVLDDGTGVFLDTDTQLTVSLSSKHNAVKLLHGRANFRAAPDAGYSFTVAAGQEIVTATRSIFDVSSDNGQVSVVLIRGNADVEVVAGGVQSTRALGDGQRLIVTGQQTVKIDKPYLLQLLAWQTGQAIFQSDSLSQVVYEMNRYSLLKLKIADSRIANMRISGVYRVGDNVQFAHSLSQLLPVVLRPVGDGIELLGDKSRMTQG